jgi:glutathione synthase/RimK-type ligase-like ATP-grasp enzyme
MSRILAIHDSIHGFHPRWIADCEARKIPFKKVNCYATNLIDQLSDCRALMWHHHQGNPRDLVVAKQILFALEHAGIPVFPDFKTGWHFDDKLGQKYLLEALQIPSPKAYAFYDKADALNWAATTSYPKVFKLRCGAGANNVILVKDIGQAKKLIGRAFGRGFPAYDAWGSLKERWRKFRTGKAGIGEPLKGCLRFFKPPPYSTVKGPELGYVYFQDFVPNNDSDTRIIVIEDKAFALKRYVRDNDFRASGSGNFGYAPELFDLRCVESAFQITDKIRTQVGVYDFVFDSSNQPLLIEISYGFMAEGYDNCPGYWDRSLKWIEGKFNPYGWMVDAVLSQSNAAKLGKPVRPMANPQG